MTGLVRLHLLGLVLAALSLSPGPPPPQPPPQPPAPAPSRSTPLAQARYQAALKQFEEVWTYYRQSRSDSFQTYYWSRLVLDSQQDLSDARADRLAALEAHLDRMRRLEELVKRVRKLGFGRSTDVGATEYYRLEAERWLEKARGEAAGG
jgi:hypothetical protein